MTDKYVCERCGHDCDDITNFRRHLLRKNVCEDKVSKISIETLREKYIPRPKNKNIPCPNCDKMYSTPEGLYLHRPKCTHSKTIGQQDNTIQEAMRQKDEEIMRLRKELEQFKASSSSDTTTNIPQRPKYAKGKITQAVKIACWNTYIGKTIGATNCLCCKNIEITQHNFECGHVIAECDGGTLAIDNLRPICNKCNQSMGSMNMQEFIEQHKF